MNARSLATQIIQLITLFKCSRCHRGNGHIAENTLRGSSTNFKFANAKILEVIKVICDREFLL